MKTYGLTKWQIQKAKDKVDFSTQFMKNNGVQIDNKMIPFSEFVTNSYTNPDRYIAELQHRAWSIYDYAKDKDLKNIFFTLTLPSKWHAQRQKSKNNKTMIFNKKFGGRTKILITTKQKNKYEFYNAKATPILPYKEHLFDLDFSQSVDKYTPRNASKELSKMLKKFFDDRSYKKIDKDNRCYFRVTEPHKDGTPHVHMSLFIPKNSQDSIVKALTRLFPAPLGKIEVNVESPVSYLMKYVLKTLDDLREEDSEISNLTLWYLYHGISRFYTSRTFVSLDVYRRLNGMYKLPELTKKYLTNEINVYIYSDTKKIAMIENEFGTIYVPKPVNWAKEKEYEYALSEDGKNQIPINSTFETVYKEDKPMPIEFTINGQNFISYNFLLKKHNQDNQKLSELGIAPILLSDILVKKTIKSYQMNDFELNKYFNSLDIDTVDDKHYIYTRNLMIERGLLEGEWLKLTAIEDINYDFEAEGVF